MDLDHIERLISATEKAASEIGKTRKAVERLAGIVDDMAMIIDGEYYRDGKDRRALRVYREAD